MTCVRTKLDPHRRGDGLENVPEVISTKTLVRNNGKVTVKIYNNTETSITLKSRAFLEQLNAVPRFPRYQKMLEMESSVSKMPHCQKSGGGEPDII